MMKSVYSMAAVCLMAGCAAGAFTACDELNDELFEKNSYIIHSGWQDYELDVDSNNKAILPVYFGINGTSANEKDVTVTMEVDPDTLEGYNQYKYKNEKDLYYKLLPAGTYTIDGNAWTIPAGELNTEAKITIDLDAISQVGSLYNDYVLPLRIASSTGEPIGPGKYSKVLAHIAFKNDYSGSYSGKGIVKQIGTTYTTEITGMNIYAINNSLAYMFVGEKNRENTEDYLNYVVEIKKEADGRLTLSSPVAGLQLKSYNAKLTRKYTMNYTDLRYYTEVTTVEFSYEYLDSTTKPDPLMMSFEGSFSKTKDVLRVEYPDVKVEE